MDIPIKAIIFDIDGTLVPTISWRELTKGFGADVDEYIKIYGMFKEGLISLEELTKRITIIWSETKNNTRSNVEKIVKATKFYPGVPEMITKLREKYTLCLISSSFKEYVEMASKKLDINDWYYNTDFYYDKNDYLVGFNYIPETRKLKLEQFHLFIKKHYIKATECALVSDSDTESLITAEAGKSYFIPSIIHKSIERKSDHILDKITSLTKYL